MEDLYLFTADEKGDRGNDIEYKTYKKLSTDYAVFKKDINLDSISELLKRGAWSSTSENQFLEYKDELLNSEYNNFRNIIYSPTVNDNSLKSNREKALTEIKKQFNLLSQNNKETTIVEVNDNNTEESKNNETPFSLVLNIFIGFLLVISFFLNCRFYKQKKDLNKKLNTPNKDVFHCEDNEIDNLKEKLSSKDNEIDNLKEKLLKSEGTHRTSDSYSSNPPYHERIPEIIPEIISETRELELPKQYLSKIIYLSIPFQNLTFANEDAREEKTIESLYLVEFDEQMQTGVLSVMVDADLSRALNSPDSYLETACTYDNEYFNNARAIQVTEKGEIKLEGDDWNVTKKVKIKFI